MTHSMHNRYKNSSYRIAVFVAISINNIISKNHSCHVTHVFTCSFFLKENFFFFSQWRFSTEKKYLFVHFYLITYLVLNLSRLIRLILNRSFFSRKVLKKSPRHRKESSPDTDSNLLS